MPAPIDKAMTSVSRGLDRAFATSHLAGPVLDFRAALVPGHARAEISAHKRVSEAWAVWAGGGVDYPWGGALEPWVGFGAQARF